MIKIVKYVTEYIVLPFPDIQPDYLLKVELWKTHHGYHPIIYIKDKFRLSESSLCGYRKHIKNYNIWVEDQWGIFPENCSVKIEKLFNLKWINLHLKLTESVTQLNSME